MEIHSYQIAYRQTGSSDEWKVITVDSHIFRIVIGSLRFNTFYDVKVAGSNTAGLGPYSSPTSIRTDGHGMSLKNY